MVSKAGGLEKRTTRFKLIKRVKRRTPRKHFGMMKTLQHVAVTEWLTRFN